MAANWNIYKEPILVIPWMFPVFQKIVALLLLKEKIMLSPEMFASTQIWTV